MIKIFAYASLLYALSPVEMGPLNINGSTEANVTFICSNWNVWLSVKHNIKYFCHSPCSKNEDIILKAAFGKTTSNNQIKLTNGEEGLSVTFTNLKKPDSGKYFCGTERRGPDAFIEVNLKVTDPEFSRAKTTPKTVISGSTPSYEVTNSSTVSSSSSDIMSVSVIIRTTRATSPSATQAHGSVPYLMIGAVVLITILIVLLKFMRKMTKKQLKVVSRVDTLPEDTQDDVEYDEIRSEDQRTVSQVEGVSTVYYSADPDSLYANYSYHQNTGLAIHCSLSSKLAYPVRTVTDSQCDLVYSLVQLPKKQTKPTGQSEPNQSESNENESLYSLAT
uniref:uncharacterized protein LOC124069499 n=1 Tax=Scatophagus argus TaxID=75038 RepID=UPI001ED83100|nr:uncharacterized protein LOC124069499 [Scatophagus argus]